MQENIGEVAKTATIYLPQKINPTKIMESYTDRRYSDDVTINADKAAYIISRITALPQYEVSNPWSDSNAYTGFTPIKAQYLQDMGVNGYRGIINHLTGEGIIESDGYYIKGEKSLGYKYIDSKYYRKPLISYKITYPPIVENYGERRVNDHAKATYEHLHKYSFSDKLVMDDKVLDEIFRLKSDKKLTQPQLKNITTHEAIVNQFIDKESIFRTDDFGGRLYTGMGIMKSELRSFITYDNQELVGLDLSNAQLFLFQIFLEDNELAPGIIVGNYGVGKTEEIKAIKIPPAEVELYKSWVNSATLYEELGRRYKKVIGKEIERKILKKNILTLFYGKNEDVKNYKITEVFVSVFPNVYKLIECFRQETQSKGISTDKEHTLFSRMMHKLEVNVFLDSICKEMELKHPEIPIFPIHDCIVTTEGCMAELKEVMNDVILKMIGEEPIIKYEPFKEIREGFNFRELLEKKKT